MANDLEYDGVPEKGGGLSPNDSSSDLDGHSEFAVSEKRLLRKLDRHLLPGVCLLYLLSFLDRSNVANARLDGLAIDLHMTGNQYATLCQGNFDPCSGTC